MRISSVSVDREPLLRAALGALQCRGWRPLAGGLALPLSDDTFLWVASPIGPSPDASGPSDDPAPLSDRWADRIVVLAGAASLSCGGGEGHSWSLGHGWQAVVARGAEWTLRVESTIVLLCTAAVPPRLPRWSGEGPPRDERRVLLLAEAELRVLL